MMKRKWRYIFLRSKFLGIFTGRCDFQDTCEMHENDPDFFKNSKIYVDNIGPIKILNKKDAIPYYPHIIGSSSGSKEGAIIHLSKENYIDIEEAQRNNSYYLNFQSYFKKRKRKKQKPTIEDFYNPMLHSTSSINGVSQKLFFLEAEKVDVDLSKLHSYFYQSQRIKFLKFALENECDMYHPNFILFFKKFQEAPVYSDLITSDYNEFLELLRMHTD